MVSEITVSKWYIFACTTQTTNYPYYRTSMMQTSGCGYYTSSKNLALPIIQQPLPND